jgi:hypothetical protein
MPLLDLNIPADSPWQGFDADAFVKTLGDMMAELEEPYREFAEATKSAVLKRDRDAVQRKTSNVASQLDVVYAYLSALREPKDNSSALSGDGALFPDAVWKTRKPIPPQALAKVCLAVFTYPKLYRVLRRICLDFTDIERRQAWNAYTMSGRDEGSGDPRATWEFIEVTQGPFFVPREVLGSLILASRPVRHRVAADVALLEALALGCTSLQSVVVTLMVQQGPTEAQRESNLAYAEKDLRLSATALVAVALESPGQWRSANKKLIKEMGGDGVTPVRILWHILWELNNKIEKVRAKEPQQHAVMPWVGLRFAAVAINHRIMHDECSCTVAELTAPNIRNFGLRFMNIEGDLPDECDHCGRPGEPKDFKRCSQCKVARFCDTECFKLAWKNGHKDACEKA